MAANQAAPALTESDAYAAHAGDALERDLEQLSRYQDDIEAVLANVRRVHASNPPRRGRSPRPATSTAGRK